MLVETRGCFDYKEACLVNRRRPNTDPSRRKGRLQTEYCSQAEAYRKECCFAGNEATSEFQKEEPLSFRSFCAVTLKLDGRSTRYLFLAWWASANSLAAAWVPIRW